MKTGTVFVLVAFVILGMEMAFAQRGGHGGKNRPGLCPKVTKETGGVCAESCTGDDSCPRGMKCCFNGCGHECQLAIHVTSNSTMKLVGFLLLVTIITLSAEVQELQASVVPLKLVGTCVELCSGDWDCDLGEHCVSNGCGHICAAD